MQSTPAPGFTTPPQRRPVVWWWFLIPLATCGLGTCVMALIGGVRLRSRFHIIAAVGYFLLTLVFFVGVQFTTPGKTGPVDIIAMVAFLVIWLLGTAHVAVLQTLVRGRVPADPRPVPAYPGPVAATATGADPALAAAQWRARRRQEARALLAANPALAAELFIGRPDIPGRQYNDGGLVDVNHVPAERLVSDLGLAVPVATALVAERDRLGGFASPEELLVYCAGLTPERLEMVRDRLVFIPV